MNQPDSQYADLGVSAEKGAVKEATKDLERSIVPNTFCLVRPDRYAGNPDHCTVPHMDGVGTKGALAWIMAKETGDLGYIRRAPRDGMMMNLGDMSCVGVVGKEPIVLKSYISRNTFLVDDEMLRELIEGAEEYAAALREMGFQVYVDAGETADAPDQSRTLDLAYAADVRMALKDILPVRIEEGDVIVGLSSSGQATYEDRYNGGLGSNGYTLGRHGLLSHVYAEKYPGAYSPELDPAKVYRGSIRLDDPLEGTPSTVGDALLAPTRSYLPIVREVLKNRKGIHGIIHCTGGGQSKVAGFLPDNIEALKNDMMEMPPLMRLIQRITGASGYEMHKSLNGGHLMELYVQESRASDIIEVARSFNVEAQVVGRCVQASVKDGIPLPGARVVRGTEEHFYPKERKKA